MEVASVVLPCFNGAQWIGEAIESVLTQTYGDLELLVIDDGSTDDSKAIVASYLSDERARYIYQENRGFSAAINRGLEEGRGSLIGFVGQDDLWLPRKLEMQVRYLAEHKDVDMVHSSYLSVDSMGNEIELIDLRVPDFSTRRELMEYLFVDNFLGFETVLVKRECFREAGLFDERMMGFSDHDMWLRIAGRFHIAYMDQPLVKKREHASQLSKVVTERGLRDEFLMISKAVHQYPFLKKIVRKKLASLYYTLGMVTLRKGNSKEARPEFLRAFRCRPWKLKAFGAYMAPTLYRLAWDRYRRISPVFQKRLSFIEG